MATLTETSFGLILFLIWQIAVVWGTFYGPFVAACTPGSWSTINGDANGYFMTWISYMVALQYLVASVPFMRRIKDKAHASIADDGRPLLLLVVSSGLVMAQASFDCTKRAEGCSSYQAWAVACGCISLVLCW